MALVYVFRVISPKTLGLKLPLHKAQLLLGIAIGILMAVLFFIIERIWFADLLPSNSISTKTLLYEFTMPCLSEELMYRGVFLAILNHYLGHQWKLFNVRLGWGIIFVSLLFVMAHGVVWTGNVVGILELLIMAFVYGFLREKTDSIWPSVLCHSFADGIYYLLLF